MIFLLLILLFLVPLYMLSCHVWGSEPGLCDFALWISVGLIFAVLL